MNNDSDNQSVPPPSTDATMSVMTRVAPRLWLGFGILIGLIFLTNFISYQYILRIATDLRQVVEIEEPLEEAILEMEINAGETARAVLSYVGNGEKLHIEKIHDSEADFERFAAIFHELAETSEERALGFKVAQEYGVFKLLGDEIVELADERRADLEKFRQNILEIDELIDDKLQIAIDRNAPGGPEKLAAAFGMEINIFEAFTAILAYIAGPDPTLRERIIPAAEIIDPYAPILSFQWT